MFILVLLIFLMATSVACNQQEDTLSKHLTKRVNSVEASASGIIQTYFGLLYPQADALMV